MDSLWIVSEAQKMGFDACGVSCATLLEEESAHVEQWLEGEREGEMGYLTRNKEKRYDPRLLVAGTRSIVTVLYNYFPQQTLGGSDKFKIAKYAYGADYHEVLKNKMRLLLERIESQTGKLEGTRVFVDSAPVLDRAWAVRCGLGFIGKNTTLIHPKKGSFFFIGHLFLPIELSETGRPLTNRCGRCTKCLDACPTGALESPFHIDARKCISYLTIESHEPLPPDLKDPAQRKGWRFGCEECMRACPWDKPLEPLPEFETHRAELDAMTDDDWAALSEEEFKTRFADSGLLRGGLARYLK